MKNSINWGAASVFLTLFTAVVIAAMNIQDIKTGFREHCVQQSIEKEANDKRNQMFLESIEKLRVSVDSLRFTIQLENIKRGK